MKHCGQILQDLLQRTYHLFYFLWFSWIKMGNLQAFVNTVVSGMPFWQVSVSFLELGLTDKGISSYKYGLDSFFFPLQVLFYAHFFIVFWCALNNVFSAFPFSWYFNEWKSLNLSESINTLMLTPFWLIYSKLQLLNTSLSWNYGPQDFVPLELVASRLNKQAKSCRLEISVPCRY